MRYAAGWLFLLSAVALPVCASAADPNDFLAGDYIEPGTGEQLPYRLFEPIGYDATQSYPLVIFLHGSGESGTNNTSQVGSNIDNLYEHVKTPQYSSFLLAPQTNSGWASYDASPSDAERMVVSVIDQLETQYHIDSTRLYLTGLSMGGYGTWDMTWHYPGMFAAAVPISGGCDTSEAPLLVNQPIWCFHDADDGTVPVQSDRDMIAALQALGGNPHYTEYPNGGHNAWSRAYSEPELYDWMFSQHTVPEPASLGLAISGILAIGCYLAWGRRKQRQAAGR